jgi:hypothetical protein
MITQLHCLVHHNKVAVPPRPGRDHHQFRQSESDCSLLSALLGGSSFSLGWGGSGSGGLGLNTHTDVLSSDSLLLTHGVHSSSGFSLGLEILLADNFSLGLVDGLNKDVLVLELVTLGTQVQLVVHLAVNLLLLSIPTEQSTEDTKASHPEDLLGHTGVLGTLSLTGTLMATLALGLSPCLCARARVSSDDLSHDQSVLNKLPNVLACSHEIYN